MSHRRLRVWRAEPGRVVAVVTEWPDDEGTSITNAAETLTAKLQVEHAGDLVDVVEHYPPSEIDPDGCLSWVAIVGNTPTWSDLDPDALATRLGITRQELLC
jgi:hypothetical protein